MSRPSGQSGPGRNYPQDYIVRIRYQNSLPPPPNPPKLLDIPNPAVAQYTSTGFASKLAREQALNIEVDSELGMPLDLVHIPAVFERDESAIRPLDPPPPIHPSDRALLRPASALGKPTRVNTSGASGVSFLRRTEYISNETSRSTFKSTTSASLITSAPLAKKARSLALKAEEESDPVRILAAVMRGFDIANPDTVGLGYVAKPPTEDKSIKVAEENWKNLKHPTRTGIKPVGIYPVLPDPEALGELNGYLVYKFSSDPLGSASVLGGKKTGERDERPDVGLMRIRYLTDEGQKEGQMTLDFYVPVDTNKEKTKAIKRKFTDLEGKDLEEDISKYEFVRAYDQHATKDISQSSQSAETPMVGMCGRKKPKGAYWYPIVWRSVLKAKRNEMLAEGFFRPTVGAKVAHERDLEEENRYDIMNVKARVLTEEEKARTAEGTKRFLAGEGHGPGP
ncbi:RNA polymerase II-associated [Peziza echinospora]|nr:RNA polymerase II-associated [Peziza echinospora]